MRKGESSPILFVFLFIFLLASIIAIGSLPAYFTSTQREILYLSVFAGTGIALAYIFKR